MDNLAKANPYKDSGGKFTTKGKAVAPKGKRPSIKRGEKTSAETKKQIEASTKRVVDLIAQDKGEETAKRLEPIVREAFKQFLSGDPSKPLVVNGKEIMSGDKNITAIDYLDMIADRFGNQAVTGISAADFASGASFRNIVGKSLVTKANPYKDKGGRFTSKEKAVAIVPQRMTPQNAPTKLAGKMVESGGFTFDPKKSQLRRTGFAVSTSKDTETVIPATEFAKSGEQSVKNFLRQHSEMLSQPRMHLGGWHDKPSGKVYLDASKVVKSAKEAADLGRANDQIAFFDLATFTTWKRFPTTEGVKYLPEGSGYVNAPIVGSIPVADVRIVGKAEVIDGVIWCPVDSLLDNESIRKFVEQIMASGISKSEPTSSDVHVPTIMYNRKRRKKKIKRSEIVTKKEKLKDPKGGLTAAGRKHFKRKEGANLKPGVRGKADTPEKMRRKGSFLTRFFTNPSGPMKDDKGRPTRLALSAAAWGEPVPSDRAAAARLAQKGRNLLERYENQKKKKK